MCLYLETYYYYTIHINGYKYTSIFLNVCTHWPLLCFSECLTLHPGTLMGVRAIQRNNYVEVLNLAGIMLRDDTAYYGFVYLIVQVRSSKYLEIKIHQL